MDIEHSPVREGNGWLNRLRAVCNQVRSVMKIVERISSAGTDGGEHGRSSVRLLASVNAPRGRPCRVEDNGWRLGALSLAIICLFSYRCQAETSSNRQPEISSCILRAAFGPGQRHTVRLWITGDDSRALGSGVVTVTRANGSQPASIDCARPVVLMRLPAGRYIATIDAAAGPPRNVQFSVTRSFAPRTIDVRLRPEVPLLTAK
jgi:hypothetical protein